MHIPLTVPKSQIDKYKENYNKLTFNKNRLILFAGDQHVEHFSTTFLGEGIDKDDINPEHLFKIAESSKVSALATQIGYISQYAKDYPKVPLVVKLNSISKFLKKGYGYQDSKPWTSVKDIVEMKEEKGLNILGVGFTVYVGIKDEPQMFQQAYKVIREAHRNGLISILWVYPKGDGVENQKDPNTIITACSIGSALGPDFIKVNAPKDDDKFSALSNAVKAAGKTKVIVSGGSSIKPQDFITYTHKHLKTANTSGIAAGRNIHQKSVQKAKTFTNALHDIVFEENDLEKVLQEYYGEGNKKDEINSIR